MALDFPSNPTDGQSYESYIWSAISGAWKAKPTQGTVATPSSSAPGSASSGDVWFDTNRGISFVYYNDGTSSQWVEMLSSAVPSVNEIMPSGSVIQTARATAPVGWLLCQGQTVSRSTYPVLYAAIGTAYGAGDGVTTFLLPDLQGRIPVGQKTGTFATLGNTGGEEAHLLTGAESGLPSHTHNLPLGVGSANSSTDIAARSGGIPGDTNFRTGTPAASSAYGSASASTSASTAHNNLQPYVVMNYMIKV
jgi:microcystin-dependent protein